VPWPISKPAAQLASDSPVQDLASAIEIRPVTGEQREIRLVAQSSGSSYLAIFIKTSDVKIEKHRAGPRPYGRVNPLYLFKNQTNYHSKRSRFE
jgi:hypothetical protein